MDKRYTFIDKINLFIRIYVSMFGAIFRLSAWFPFFILAMFQTAGLVIITWFHLPVWVNIVYPILTKFLPSAVFHYPGYFLAVPSIFAGLDNFILGPTIWVITSAAAVYMLGGVHSGERLFLKDGFRAAFRSYLPLLTVWIIETIVILLIFFLPAELLGAIVQGSLKRKLVFNVGLQMAAYAASAFLIYYIPGIMIGGKKVGSALAGSISLCFHNFVLTYSIIFIPSIIRMATDIMLTLFAADLLRLFHPEMIFIILLAKVVLGIFINLFIYGSATFIYKEMTK